MPYPNNDSVLLNMIFTVAYGVKDVLDIYIYCRRP
jgi:hypothetical protein